MRRRDFLRGGLLAVAGWAAARDAVSASTDPRVVSTHAFGRAANQVALERLLAGGSAVDAVEAGAMVIEADPAVVSVGYGGRPNALGVVQLDAAVMNGTSLEAGAVAALEGIEHPVAVARRVMEVTPHVVLVGSGARRFAVGQGFATRDLLTGEARGEWRAWKAGERAAAVGHDTIGMVARAADGSMAVSCTTSGLAWKLPGRVGDSPLVGHGLYCDDRAGGAAATGVGEEIIKVCGSYQVVEFMRQGASPDEAIRRVMRRIVRRDAANRDRLIAFVAMRADGEIGFGSLIDGFEVAVSSGGRHRVLAAPRVVG